MQVAELNEATKLMAEKIESSNSRSLRTLATEDLSAKNLLSQVNSIRLKVRAACGRGPSPSMCLNGSCVSTTVQGRACASGDHEHGRLPGASP